MRALLVVRPHALLATPRWTASCWKEKQRKVKKKKKKKHEKQGWKNMKEEERKKTQLASPPVDCCFVSPRPLVHLPATRS